MSISLQKIVEDAAALKSSDIHLSFGSKPKIRVDGDLIDLPGHEPLTEADCEDISRQLADEDFPKIGEQDFAVQIAGHRLRVNVYRQSKHVACALRILSDNIPNLEDLNLPKVVGTFPSYEKGIVLVTGETGSGKSTTLAAILKKINQTRPEHIITLEDPIEYVHEEEMSLIDQREIGVDTNSYANGLRAILREDPDVILIGEMRDMETTSIALTAAETGHLVFATLHTNSAADSIDRIVNIFPAEQQSQVRMQVSTTLKAVLSQQLLKKRGGGRIAACETMIVNDAIRNNIRDGKTHMIFSAISTTRDIGGMTMDNHIIELYRNRTINKEVAIAAAHDEEYIKKSIV